MWIYGALSQNQQGFAIKVKFWPDCGSLAPRGNNILAHAGVEDGQRPAAEARGSLGVFVAVAVISDTGLSGISAVSI
jgi:hypothetical protein